jgi:hypothetical protein
MDGLRDAFLSELRLLDQDGVILGLIQLINRLRLPGPPYHPVILDLCCLIRTLWQLRLLTREQLWAGNFMSQGVQWICEAKVAMEGLFAMMTSKVVDEGAIQQRTHSALWALNRFQAMTRLYGLLKSIEKSER